ncbi:uncharacterized protein LOC120286099 [Eucalyptus grandis]|uniref:uncharacterized protein LOC120286099 n=1 Tax=Eucalyptus grandis TaxID=71139 RepID=UPI00192F03E1|nr:uncharacterized protein LOC120286099 [Eucalyptus grandis]
MHDIVNDVAISIASTEWKALVGREDCGFKNWSKAELRECTVISFLRASIDELPEKLDCPNLRMFLLVDCNLSLKIPDSFFESMHKLQVMELGVISVTSLPSSIEFLENLKSLSLASCHLEDVTLLGKLKALQILHLCGSTIARLPKEIGELTKLRILNLKSCTRLKVIEPDVLGSLVNLEELYMADSFDRWEVEDEAPRRNASLIELKNMNKLSTLDIVIPHFADLPRDLPFGKLNKYKIQIGGFWDWSVEYKESRTLKLKLDLGNLLFEEWVQKCLQRTQDLHLDGLQDGNDSIHDLCIEGFQELKYLHVQNSPSFHYVVHPTNNVQCTAFTRLVSLFLENMGKFEKICGSCLALESFSKLKIVKVDNCSEIKHLFPSSMMRLLSQLEEIEISRCHLMQQIVADVEVDKDEIYDPNVKSCNLRRLILRNLPNMTSFYKTANLSVDFFDGQQVLFPSLEELKLSSMFQLKRIWHNQLHGQSFYKLASLTVELCENLSHVFPSNLMDRLHNLNKIEVVGCPSLEALFDTVTLSSNERQKPLVLSSLEKMKLLNLPRLRDILKSGCIVISAFPSLVQVSVRRCHSLPYLFSSATARTLDKLAVLDVSCCNNMKGIIAMEEGKGKTIETFKFRNLSILKLGDLENLICFSSKSCAGDGLHPLFDEKFAFPKLEELNIEGVHQEELWNNKILVESFCCLKVLKVKQCHNLINVIPSFMWRRLLHHAESLTVEKCPRLRNLFTTSMAKSLGQLRYLGLNGCGEMEYIVAKEEEKPEEETDKIVIPQIVTLYLHSMPRLRSFCQGKHISEWPSLKEFTVKDCEAVKVILGDANCRKLEGSVPTQQPLLLVEKVIPHLEGLTLAREDAAMMPQHYVFHNLRELTLACYHDENVAFLSNFLLHRFPNLEMLTVRCSSFEEIFPKDSSRHGVATPCGELTNMEKPLQALQNLRQLNLDRLCNLKRVWKDGSLIAEILKQIEVLWIGECPSLSIVLPSRLHSKD